MLFYPIYNQLQKRIKKLYGDDKRVEMEQYLIENFNFSYRVKKNVSQIQDLKEARSTSSKVIRYVSFLLFLLCSFQTEPAPEKITLTVLIAIVAGI